MAVAASSNSTRSNSAGPVSAMALGIPRLMNQAQRGPTRVHPAGLDGNPEKGPQGSRSGGRKLRPSRRESRQTQCLANRAVVLLPLEGEGTNKLSVRTPSGELVGHAEAKPPAEPAEKR